MGITLQLSQAAADGIQSGLSQAVEDRLASRIFAQDPTLWGPEAEAEAAIRLNWTNLAQTSRSLVEEIAELRSEVNGRGLDHVVLCGMGGSSLAPEVICRAANVTLTVLDSSHPDAVRAALSEQLERTVVVVSSKSGGTVETDSQRRAYERAFSDADLDPAEHIIVVTDPGSPLDVEATELGYRVFNADPNVGGRYSALTAFGLVPSGLAGAPIGSLLDEAAQVQAALAADSPDNPALVLGAAMGIGANNRTDKLALVDRTGLSDWIEQLVAESTGKQGLGILPVPVTSDAAPNADPSTSDSIVVGLGSTTPPVSSSQWSAAITATLGAQFLTWEVATAIAGRFIGIDPFDQPDVESAKQAARDQLGAAEPAGEPDIDEGSIAVYGTSATTLEAAIEGLLAELDTQQGYLAIQTYVDRQRNSQFAQLRELLAKRTGRPTTFGWGPRFLHSTGQYHKGGPPTGVFLQITDEPQADLAVPGRDFSFGEFIASQAAGDAQVLRSHNRPVLRLHVRDAAAALPRLRELVS